jgi:hypothetical protein
MSGNNQGWYWTPERLLKLRQVLNRAAKRDEQGHYLGPIGLSAYASANGKHEGLAGINIGQAAVGLKIFLFLGALEPSVRGAKSQGYKRRYYPDKLDSITVADIQRFRQSRGVASPMPPAR